MKARALLPVVVSWLALAGMAPAQPLDPIQWSLSVAGAARPGAKTVARLTARMAADWHLYSLSTPKGGPIPTTIAVTPHPAVEAVRIFQPRPERKFDPNFNLDTETYGGEVVFYLDVALKPDAPAGPMDLAVQVRYQACTDKQCMPPRRKTVTAKLTVAPGAPPSAVTIPAGYLEFRPGAGPAAAPSSAATPPPAAPGPEPVLGFLLVAFGFGLAAIFTPCVFPMIPITLSYFLNRASASRGQIAGHAALFCAGIVVLFTSLGAAATALAGPFAVVQLGSSIWVNGFISAVFLAFGLSLLGAFEITIPSSLLTRLDRASSGGGVFGTLLMGLTFSLTAFACVGPFVGTLLAGSIQGGGLRPLLGMAAFSSGLALPFFVLALFPGFLKQLPRSGGWLARVKIVMGFLILAAALKYLSNIDQVLQWNLLTRERFLAAWVILFAMPGIYLLGFLRLEGVNAGEPVGLWRLMFGAAFLAFALNLVPGMFGARLGELDAYVPLPSRSSLAGEASGGSSRLEWIKNDYPAALARSKAEGKPLFVYFTGYACTNCHWMKANMLPRPEIAEALRRFVLVELYTDGADPASEANQRLQETRFRTVAIPYYAILNSDEQIEATFPGLTRDPREFLRFLQTGAL